MGQLVGTVASEKLGVPFGIVSPAAKLFLMFVISAKSVR
jgi:hypothetical protein